MKSAKRKNKESVINKHIKSVHEDEVEKVDFQMELRGKFNNPLSRIINEGIRIKDTNPNNLLNSKNEHFGPSIQRKSENIIKCNVCRKSVKSHTQLNNHVRIEHHLMNQ